MSDKKIIRKIRAMEYVFILIWHNRCGGSEIIGVYTSAEGCCEMARKYGVAEEQLEKLDRFCKTDKDDEGAWYSIAMRNVDDFGEDE